MSRARRKNNRIGLGRRLVKDSLILSCTGSVSSRVVRVFEEGSLSPLTKSVKKVDHFVRKRVTGPVFQKLELRKNFSMPARNAISKFIMNNSFFQRISELRTKFMNASLRSVGIFLLTFSIYSAAIFMLKNYISLSVGSGEIDDLIISAISMVVGILLLLFGDKSIIYSLGNGVITGRLLWGVLGINDTTIDKASSAKAKTSIGISFLLGSLLGVLTMFFTSLQVMFAMLTVIVAVVIFNVPEFGLMLTMACVAAISVEQLFVLAWITTASYLLKCIRLKRNLRFGTADALIFVIFIFMLISFAVSGMSITKAEEYILCFTALYFPVKNMMVSKKLLCQTFNSLTVGAFLGMLAYAVDEFAPILPYSQIKLFSEAISINSFDTDMLAVLVMAVLPFAFYTFSSKINQKRNLLFVLVAIGCAFVADSLVFYGMILLSLFIYVAVAYKAPAGAFLAAVSVMPVAMWALSYFTFSDSVVLFNIQKYDSLISGDGYASSFWQTAFNYVGGWLVLLLVVSVLLVLQRIFATVLFADEPENRIVFGAVGSGAVNILLMSLAFNLFADIRLISVFWFILGLCGSAYKVYSVDKLSQEVHDNAEA